MVWLRSLRLPITLILAALPLAATASEQDATDWLERMVQSAHRLNYTGTFVYQQGATLQSMKIIHSVSEQGERERLVSLTGPSREVIRNQERVTCILPKDSPIVVEHAGAQRPFSLTLPTDLDPLRENYQITLHEGDRIAGLEAKKVLITPRDNYRYGQRFWLAKDSGLLLRAEVINEQGDVVEQVMFTQLETHEVIPEEMLKPRVSDNVEVIKLEPPAEQPASNEGANAFVWQVADLPPGFALKFQRNLYLPEKTSPVEHHVYSDGLASVSVFIENRMEDEDTLVGPSAMGGVNAYGRELDEHSVTVVGEVPPLTVEKIAMSLERGQP